MNVVTSKTFGFAGVAFAACIGGANLATAADLGGNCCGELEERIAELEATTVRKGNRKVTLQISGHVGHSVLWWDDGLRKDMYFADNGVSESRWRFTGTAKINADLTAGFLYEFGIHNNSTAAVNQTNGGDDLGGVAVPGILRDSTVWLRHRNLGMVKIGHGSTATDNLILIDLGQIGGGSSADINVVGGGLFTTNPGGGAIATDGVGVVPITLNNMMLGTRESFDTDRRNHVLYETPSLMGFTVQASVAEDNFWDVALRYAGEFSGFRLAAGIGYRENTEFNAAAGAVPCTSRCNDKESVIMGSASLLHVQSGLFVTGSAGQRERESQDASHIGSSDNRNIEANFWYLAGGISRNFFGLGKTVLYGEYSQHDDALRFQFTDVVGSEVTHWGLGVTQHIDAAAMELFATFKHFESEFDRNNGTLAAPVFGHVVFRDVQLFMVGTKINF